jgi:hypothetical protein
MIGSPAPAAIFALDSFGVDVVVVDCFSLRGRELVLGFCCSGVFLDAVGVGPTAFLLVFCVGVFELAGFERKFFSY